MIWNFTPARKTVIDKGQQPSRIGMTEVMKMRLFPLMLSVTLLAATSAFGQSIPSWKSVTQTGSIRNLVLSAGNDNSVAAWLGKKADTTNGQLQNPSMRGGSASGTDISAAIALALDTKIARSISAHFGDTLNLADYGVVCDGVTDNASALQAAFTEAATNSRYASGVKIVIPFGVCYSSVGASLSATDDRSFGLEGAGVTASTLQFGAGGISALVNGQGGFSGELFHIQRKAAASGDIGLTVTASEGGANGYGQVDLSRVRVDSLDRASSYQIGVKIFQASLNASNLFIQLRDSAEDTVPTPQTSALDLSGTASTHTDTQEGYLWSIDNKIVNSTFQGGYNGVHIHGAVQGVFVTNAEALGNTKGVNWEGGGAANYAELLYVSNFHGNNHVCGVCTTGDVNQITITGNLFLHFGDGPTSSPWAGVSLTTGQQAEVTGNTGNTGGAGGSEALVSLTDMNFSTVQGNSSVTMNGPVVVLNGTSSFDIVTGNMGNSSGSYTGPGIVGCYDPVAAGARYRQCFNNLLNTTRDVYTDDQQSLHIASLGTIHLDGPGGIETQSVTTDAGEIDANVGGNHYRLLHTSGISEASVCSDTATCTIGNVGGTTTLNGTTKAAGDLNVNGNIQGINITAGPFISLNAEFDARVGGNTYRLFASPGIGSSLVCPDTGTCSVGSAGGTLALVAAPIVPSMTKAAILGLPSATEGMIVNESDDHALVVYENGHWYPMTLGPALQ